MPKVAKQAQEAGFVIVSNVEDLSPVKEGFTRLYHGTFATNLQSIKESGLVKLDEGSPVLATINPQLVEGGSVYGDVQVVFDVPTSARVTRESGMGSGIVQFNKILPEQIVGVFKEVVPTTPIVKPLAVEVAKPPVEVTEQIETLKTKPLKTVPVPEEVAVTPIGKKMLTPAQIEKLLTTFGLYVESPNAINAWELTRELRRETLAGRAENLQNRTQELIVDKGISAEEAMNQAIGETMRGELPEARTDYLDDLTNEMRDALFNKVYQELKAEPFEMMSTAEALTNALLGKPIPRIPGIKGGSAYTRLQRVFAPEVFKAINKASQEGKSLQGMIEGLYEVVGQEPIPVDKRTANYLRNLSTQELGKAYLMGTALSKLEALRKLSETKTPEEIAKETSDLKIELAPEPQPPKPPYEPPIENAIDQMPLFPRPTSDMIIKVLKEIGWSPVDIGNFLRANKASFDFSFWRQQAPLIASHPITFTQANIEAWKALWSQTDFSLEPSQRAEGSYHSVSFFFAEDSSSQIQYIVP